MWTFTYVFPRSRASSTSWVIFALPISAAPARRAQRDEHVPGLAGLAESNTSNQLCKEHGNVLLSILGDPARPVIDKGVVFAVSHGGKMIATSESNGERLWTRNIGSTQMPWVAGDTVYVVDLGGKLWALSRSDGAVRWAADLPPGGRWSGPVLAGGRLWLVSGDGLLIGADARSGQVLSNLDLGTAVYVSPVVAGGRMFILADNAR